jgi:hypothetical protein
VSQATASNGVTFAHRRFGNGFLLQYRAEFDGEVAAFLA